MHLRLMHLTLRQKINMIVATAAIAFVFLMAVSWYLNSKMEYQTSFIRDQYIPHVELGYRLEMRFHEISLSLRDAVAAQDNDGLELVQELKNKLIQELETSSVAINPKETTAFKIAIEDYVSFAIKTSQRLINGETGLNIVDAMTEMQSKQALASSTLSKITTFDRGKLEEAFTVISLAQERGSRIRFLVSVGSVTFIFIISFLMGRSFILRIQAITNGLARFGEGDFSESIPVSGTDELSDLSHKVNMMASRIQSLVREIESFSYSVAHDLRAPLRSLMGFSVALLEDHSASLSEEGKSYLSRVAAAAQRMGHMVDGLLGLSRLNRTTLVKQEVDLSKIANAAIDILKTNDPNRKVSIKIEENILALGDPKLLDNVLTNLFGNAWKFTKNKQDAQIQFGCKKENDVCIFFVQDNGAGFNMRYSDKLFGTFQRLHSESEFEGHGIGLATVKNIIDKHGGKIWAESEINVGTTFYFTLG